jgi:hypothetical protein
VYCVIMYRVCDKNKSYENSQAVAIAEHSKTLRRRRFMLSRYAAFLQSVPERSDEEFTRPFVKPGYERRTYNGACPGSAR